MSALQDENQIIMEDITHYMMLNSNMQTELDYYRSMYSNDTPQPNIVVPNPSQPEITYERPMLMRTDTLQKPTLTRSQTAHYE